MYLYSPKSLSHCNLCRERHPRSFINIHVYQRSGVPFLHAASWQTVATDSRWKWRMKILSISIFIIFLTCHVILVTTNQFMLYFYTITLTKICDAYSQVCVPGDPKRSMSGQVRWWLCSALVTEGTITVMADWSGPVTPARRWIWPVTCHQRSRERRAFWFMEGVSWFSMPL